MNDVAIQFVFRIGLASAFLAASGIFAVLLLTMLRCTSPYIHRATWCLVLVQGVLLFQMPVSIPWFGKAMSNYTPAPNDVTIDSPESSVFGRAESEGQSYEATPVSHDTFSALKDTLGRHWAICLLVAWISGILFLLGRWVIGYIQFVRNIECEECDLEDWCREWAEIIQDSSHTNPPQLYVSSSSGPMLCRWPRGYGIVVPFALWRKLSTQQRKAILRHELCHFERCDVYKFLFANLIALVHWFNPIAWLAVRRFQDSIEWICDDRVQALTTGQSTTYAKALLAIGGHDLPTTGWSTAVFGGGLSGRIRRLVTPGSPPDSIAKKLIPLVLLTGLVLVHVVKVELYAQETGKTVEDEKQAALENARTLKFFAVPVDTEFQRSQLPDENVVAYANIDITPLIGEEGQVHDIDQFDSEALEEALKRIREKSGPGALWFMADFGSLTSVGNSYEEVDTILERIGQDAGFEKVRVVKGFQASDTYQWKGLPEVEDAEHDEPRLGNDAVHVYPIRTPLGRYLGGADCVIKVAEPISLEAQQMLSDADKVTIRDALQQMAIPADASVWIHVVLDTDDIDAGLQLPQVKKGAEFHRDAVDFLQAAGFNEVKVSVEAPRSVRYTSRYE